MVTYNAQAKRLISIFITNIPSLKSFTITDYTDDSIDLKSGQFNFTLKFKNENNDSVMIIDWKFNHIGSQNTLGMENVGGKKLTNQILEFIDNNLNEDEKTDSSRKAIIDAQISKEKLKKNFQIVSGFLIIFCLIIGLWIGGIFNTSSSSSNPKSTRSSSSAKPKSTRSSYKAENPYSKWAGYYDFGVIKYRLKSDGTGRIESKAFGIDNSSPIKWQISGNTIYCEQTDGNSDTVGKLYIKGNSLSLYQ